jgi:hypothetical protein
MASVTNELLVVETLVDMTFTAISPRQPSTLGETARR